MTASSAIFNDQDLICVDDIMVGLIEGMSVAAPAGSYRLCLHHSVEDPVQEMIIAHSRDTYCRPHRHRGRSVTYHLIRGEMSVFFFSDDGSVTRRVEMGGLASGKFLVFHLRANSWYMPLVRSRQAVFLEVLGGPHAGPQATEYAPWSPAADDPGAVKTFLKRLAAVEPTS